MKKFFFFFLGIHFAIFSYEPFSQKVVVKGIWVSGKVHWKMEREKEMRGVEIDRSLRISEYEDLKKKLTPFIGRYLTSDLVIEVKEVIRNFYQKEHEIEPKIVIPFQNFSDGILHVQVLEQVVVQSAPEKDVRMPPERLQIREKPIISALRGVVLVADKKDVGKLDPEDFLGMQAYGIEIPCGIEKLRCNLEPFFIGQPLTTDLLYRLKKEIIEFYQKCKRPVVIITLPEQEITNGVVYLVVTETKLGEICVEGNRWFPASRYKNLIRMKPGSRINTDRLLSDLAWINRNPFRRADLFFTPGKDLGTTDIKLMVKDHIPLRVYAGGDNTGSDITGNTRFFTGVTWGNALFLDHIAEYQYTTSRDFKKFQMHSGNYTIPLPWHHFLFFFGGYCTIEPKINRFFQSNSAHTAQASIRYVAPFGKTYKNTLKQFAIGFDWKNTDNNLNFVSDGNMIPIVTKTINLTQFMGGFSYGKETNHHKITASIDLFWSPGKILHENQSDKDFNNLNPGAVNNYVYGRATLGEVIYFLHKWAFSVLTRGQFTNHVLLQSEEFGLGGYDTVRGFNERELNADNALCVNVELRTRPLHLFKWKKRRDDLIILAFFDYGLGHLKFRGPQVTPPVAMETLVVRKYEYLMSFGPGIRYTIAPNLMFRFDWGIKLHKAFSSDSSWSKVHLGAVLSF
ncbi:MAG: BamA/TamA family outer membrane protein [Chlamydiae bacterium]|nr:BamA/TamA family outer membrane protein [Chlamydiota bacterium]